MRIRSAPVPDELITDGDALFAKVSTNSEHRAGQLPSFASLRAFEAVFRHGGIRKAADQLNLNHAVVSRHVRLLEDWLGVALVVRNGNRLFLTEEGEKYHARISAAVAEMVSATDDLVERRDGKPLRLWCVPGFATQWLARHLAEFERANPDCKVELKPTDAQANLLVYEADADIRLFLDSMASLPRGLRAFELARPELWPLASPELAAELERHTQPGSCLEWPFLHDTDDSEWRVWLHQNGHVVPDALPGSLYWHSHLTIAAAREGRGVVIASKFLVDGDLKEGALVKIELPDAQPVILGSYFLVAREDRWSNPTLIRLRAFLRQKMAEVTGESII